MRKLKVLVCGAGGAMGKTLSALIENTEDIELVCGFDSQLLDCSFKVYNNLSDIKEDIDVAIDFSHYSVTDKITEWCVENKVALVSAVTGISQENLDKIKEASKVIPVFRSANFSYGVSVMKKLLATATRLLNDGFDVELIEAHHNKKADAPSGTANMLLDIIEENSAKEYDLVYGREGNCGKRKENEIGVHSIRGGGIAGEHEVEFISDDEIITIRHCALSKRVFAAGALRAAKYIACKENGFYDMDGIANE